MANRDYGAEIDALQSQLNEIQRIVKQLAGMQSEADIHAREGDLGAEGTPRRLSDEEKSGGILYSGRYRGEQGSVRWAPQERTVRELLDLDGEKAAKVLAALGHKQRIDILKSVFAAPLTGSELVEQLHMGTTGQLYHHLKALQGADLLVQEERGGTYAIPPYRALPLLLLWAAASELLDASDYIALAEARNNAGDYLGTHRNGYDPLHLAAALIENSVLEHQAGHCTEVHLFLHGDGSLTIADNGRGIPVQAFAPADKTPLQAILTDIGRSSTSAFITAPGAEHKINAAVVNALSQRLTVEIRRGGSIFRQEFKRGIPQTGLLTVGATRETGTSITFLPDRDLFRLPVSPESMSRYIRSVSEANPGLSLRLHGNESGRD
ncbi:helix-turn-helix domain-containing protein [Paenibacillus dendritiformis]|uniref:helix-turn-helix domain-containing protein n=1 Tax=Paenibacillus dendritiformis TaxID=130049 RepID=UPI00143D3404|nr:helix-turn-helix domain-containing protein [Paenibacillus dendritiformis]NKI23675.1 helix-turn-helix domain-containing protein [Paenibacillus dendritiformis]NRF99419.1 helix-turn-helix domain-containing protein [Paenibacillus dendritiformis]